MNRQQYFSTKEIAEIFGLKPNYLAKLRQLQTGPNYIRIGKLIRYRLDDVTQWITEQGSEIRPTGLI